MEEVLESMTKMVESRIARYKGIKQRDANWYKLIGWTIGASEINTITGKNRYSSIENLIEDKVNIILGLPPSFTGNNACWWGQLFEDVVTEVIQIDLGSKVVGDDICIQSRPGHRTSPDGYIVALMDDETGEILFTNMETPELVSPYVFLLEYKCPLVRVTEDKIPNQYIDQVQSGLGVSPFAHYGLFIDSTFRKCKFEDLKFTPEYDINYHSKSKHTNKYPYAWGIIAIYGDIKSSAFHQWQKIL